MSHPPLTPAQCRAARALLRWSIARLAEAAEVGETTVSLFEQYRRRSMRATMWQLRRALEEGGVIFIDDEGDIGGPGVRLAPHAPEAIEVAEE